MPTYEYRCSRCEEVFEIFHKISDPPIKQCPVCNGSLVKLISGGVGVIFKGSGFYTTDYKKSSASSTSSNSSKPEKQDAKKEEKKKDEASKSKS